MPDDAATPACSPDPYLPLLERLAVAAEAILGVLEGMHAKETLAPPHRPPAAIAPHRQQARTS